MLLLENIPHHFDHRNKIFFENSKIIYPNSAIYTGQISNNLPNGNGCYLDDAKGYTVTGQFKDGYLHGKCRFTIKEHCMFKELYGNWNMGFFVGTDNIIKYSNDMTYIGKTFQTTSIMRHTDNGKIVLDTVHELYKLRGIRYFECKWIKNICYPPITIHYDNRVVTTNEVYLHDHYIEIDDFRIDINIAMIATNISFEKNTYSGYAINSIPHGIGMLFSDEIIHTGEWLYGSKNGKFITKTTIPNKHTYETYSNYTKGKLEYPYLIKNITFKKEINQIDFYPEYSIIKYQNGDIFEGKITEKFEKNGIGKLNVGSIQIRSNWIKDKLDTSFDSQINSNEFNYIGNISYKDKKYIFEGKGVLTKDNIIYKGEFKNNQLNGKIQITSKTIVKLCIYNKGIETEILETISELNNLPLIIKEKHHIYNGITWKINNNIGSYKNKNYEYSGSVKEYRKHGKGKMVCSNGMYIEGIWKDDNNEICTIKCDEFYFDGKIIDSNKFIIDGTHYYNNGIIYKGKTKNKQRTGVGIYYTKEWIISCKWKKNEINGLVKFTNIKTGNTIFEYWSKNEYIRKSI